jgi:hypothetical protein
VNPRAGLGMLVYLAVRLPGETCTLALRTTVVPQGCPPRLGTAWAQGGLQRTSCHRALSRPSASSPRSSGCTAQSATKRPDMGACNNGSIGRGVDDWG